MEKSRYDSSIIMNSELKEKLIQINKIDQAIREAEEEVKNGEQPISLEEAKDKLDTKYIKEKRR